MIECERILKDKHEIPIPEMARRFSRLERMANEIPSFDNAANIHQLIGRDAPELLKVREFRNGLSGTPGLKGERLGGHLIQSPRLQGPDFLKNASNLLPLDMKQ